MRIEGTYGIGPGGAGKGSQGKAQRVDQATVEDATIPDDPEIRHLHRKYLKEPAGAEETDRGAITEARELLNSGKLDTPDAIARAAEAIVDLGT